MLGKNGPKIDLFVLIRKSSRYFLFFIWSLEDQSYSKSLFISFCRNVWITQPNLAPKLTWHLLQIYFLRSKFLPVGRELFYTPKSWMLSFLESLSKIKAVMTVNWFVCVLLSQQILKRPKTFDLKTSCLQQILHGLSLDIKIYSPEVSNNWRHKVKLSIIFARMSEFDAQRKCMQYVLYYILIFWKNEQNEKNFSSVQIINFYILIRGHSKSTFVERGEEDVLACVYVRFLKKMLTFSKWSLIVILKFILLIIIAVWNIKQTAMKDYNIQSCQWMACYHFRRPFLLYITFLSLLCTVRYFLCVFLAKMATYLLVIDNLYFVISS